MSTQSKQFREFIIRPTLKHLGKYNGIELWSPVAENLLVGTACQESQLKYIDQLSPGPGPAYGFFQMEQATLNDHMLWLHGKGREHLLYRVEQLRGEWAPPEYELHGNVFFATAMCRIHYLRVAAPLPEDPNDIAALAAYWKRYYNTIKGKGTVDEFVRNYR